MKSFVHDEAIRTPAPDNEPQAVSGRIATNNAMVEKTYTLEQAAPILHQTVRTLRQWRKDGKIECFKMGKVWVVSDDELQRVIDEAKKRK